MKLYYILFANVITTAFSFSENDRSHRDWLKPDWLKPIEVGDSRPPWWFDVWGGDGILFEGIITDDKDLNKSKHVEILKLETNGETSRIKMMPISVKIGSILSISDSIKIEDLSLMSGEKIVVYCLVDSKYGSGIWNRGSPFKKGDSFVFFAEKIGAIMPGNYYVKWTMDNELVNNFSEIIKSRNLHLGRTSKPLDKDR